MSNDRESEHFRKLRETAENKLRDQMERLNKLSTRDINDLVHELGTHQIELEMQNEELRRTQEDLEASRSRYAELYDFAPIGYFTFDPDGLIKEVNLTGAQMLDVERRSLINKPFAGFIAESGDRDLFHNHCKEVLAAPARMACELRLKKKTGLLVFAHLESIAVRDHDGAARSLRTALSDITDRKADEAERERLNLAHLDTLSKLKTLTGLLPICMHCKRIRNDEGYWSQLEAYISGHSEAEFSHGLCDECAEKLYPRYFKSKEDT